MISPWSHAYWLQLYTSWICGALTWTLETVCIIKKYISEQLDWCCNIFHSNTASRGCCLHCDPEALCSACNPRELKSPASRSTGMASRFSSIETHELRRPVRCFLHAYKTYAGVWFWCKNEQEAPASHSVQSIDYAGRFLDAGKQVLAYLGLPAIQPLVLYSHRVLLTVRNT